MNVSRKFSEDFEVVADHYRLKEFGEYEAAKAAARSDIDTAIATFSKLACEVPDGTA